MWSNHLNPESTAVIYESEKLVRAGDPPTLVASADKIRKELGWASKYTDLQSIIETAWRWHKTHPNGYAE